MAGKTDFTEDEWQALENGVIGAGMFVSVSEPDFTHMISESNALSTYLAEQGKTNGSKLVRELANAQVNLFASNAPSGRIEVEALKALRSAAATLAEKAPREVDAYRELALGVADHVARDAGGVRPRETSAIGKIRGALGIQ
jgi:hypothetical protein